MIFRFKTEEEALLIANGVSAGLAGIKSFLYHEIPKLELKTSRKK